MPLAKSLYGMVSSGETPTGRFRVIPLNSAGAETKIILVPGGNVSGRLTAFTHGYAGFGGIRCQADVGKVIVPLSSGVA